MEVDFSNAGSLHNTGYRPSKYQFSRTSDDGNNFSSVDLVLLRLAEIYLMRAEAKLRNGDVAGALADVNIVRTSRDARPEQTPAALSAIDLDIIYRERGFELHWEGFRRGDQIRFGTYEDSWTGKTDSDVIKGCSLSRKVPLMPLPVRMVSWNRIPGIEKGFWLIFKAVCMAVYVFWFYSGSSCKKKSTQIEENIRVAFMSDVYLLNLRGTLEDIGYSGIKNRNTDEYALIRTMNAQLHSTRLFNENYYAFRAALDDAVQRGNKLVALPGDFSDEGQPLNIRGLNRFLDKYGEKHGISFFLTTGNHDPNRPFDIPAGKSEFWGKNVSHGLS